VRKDGADGRARTGDNRITGAALYQLSYVGQQNRHSRMNPRRSFEVPDEMKPVEPRWRESGAVLVCEKCYKTRIPEEIPELAERIGDFKLREWLKARCKEAGFGKRVRVIGTTCQDICGAGVTVTILPAGSGGPMETFEIDPLEDREAILQRIIEKLR
jgi:hypothetical protein